MKTVLVEKLKTLIIGKQLKVINYLDPNCQFTEVKTYNITNVVDETDSNNISFFSDNVGVFAFSVDCANYFLKTGVVSTQRFSDTSEYFIK